MVMRVCNPFLVIVMMTVFMIVEGVVMIMFVTVQI